MPGITAADDQRITSNETRCPQLKVSEWKRSLLLFLEIIFSARKLVDMISTLEKRAEFLFSSCLDKLQRLDSCTYRNGMTKALTLLSCYTFTVKKKAPSRHPVYMLVLHHIFFIGTGENSEKPMTNISNMFLQMCVVNSPKKDVYTEERNVFISPFFLPSPEIKTVKLKVRYTF